MSISIYSVAMGIIWFSISALIGSVVLRNTSKGGLLLVALIFVLSLFRMFVPLDFDNSIVIHSEHWYPLLQDWIRSPLLGQITVGTSLLFIWFIGALVRFLLLIKKLILLHKFCKSSVLAQPNSRLMELAREVSKELNYAGESDLSISSKTSTAYQAGFVRPFILLPANVNSFSDEEIRSMMRHELCHFLGNDLWIKTGLQIMTCILWWNPIAFLFNQSIEQMLELRCDQRACENLTKEAQFSYLQTLIHLVEVNSKESSSLPLAYIGNREDQYIIQRFKLITEDNTHAYPQAKVICSIAICFVLFFTSYVFIIQPWTAPPSVEENSSDFLDSSFSYIIHTPDGQFELFVEGMYICTLLEDELAQEPLCNYIIYEGGFPNEETQLSDN